MNPTRTICLFFAAFILFAVSACNSKPAPSLLDSWSYSNLRLLDLDDADHPSHDLTAVYLRDVQRNLQIRLDLLEGSDDVDYDLYLVFDLQPGGMRALPVQATSQIDWDMLLIIPAHGSIELLKSDGTVRAGSETVVVRDLERSAVLIDLRRQGLDDWMEGFSVSYSLKMQVFLTSASGSMVADQTKPISLEGQPPQPAQVLLAFWNTYPAYTPASALRRWDGAHTGPNGGRHGLYNLLRSAAARQIPLFLLDLNEPASLSALDYAGKLMWLKELQSDGLVMLPAVLPDPGYGPYSISQPASVEIQEWIAQVSNEFGTRTDGFVYAPQRTGLTSFGNAWIFLPISASGSKAGGDSRQWGDPLPGLSPLRWRGNTLFPIYQPLSHDSETGTSNLQATEKGLSTEWKRILLHHAVELSLDPRGLENQYINLGGSLPDSTWGIPEPARATFRWLRENPWVRILNAHDLRALKPISPPNNLKTEAEKTGVSQQTADVELEKSLLTAPDNPAGQAAWQAYYALYAPIFPNPASLPELRENYTREVWSLLAAADWAADPHPLSSCQTDPDMDGYAECTLASENVYSQYEVRDSSLTHLFILAPRSSQDEEYQSALHQVIGPSSQIITGLSSPYQWEVDGERLTDPADIAGAFSGPGIGFRAENTVDGLRFYSQDGSTLKSFRLTPSGISVDIQTPLAGKPPPMLIPLLLDPWLRFLPGWVEKYDSHLGEYDQTWNFANGSSLRITSTSKLDGMAFRSSQVYFNTPEDPNLDYAVSHFIPLPLSLVEVQNKERILVTLDLVSEP